MYKRFIKWDIAKDAKGETVNVYEDAYGRLFIDETFWFDKEFLAIETDVFVNTESWNSAPRRYIRREEIAKIQAALREHRAEYPAF